MVTGLLLERMPRMRWPAVVLDNVVAAPTRLVRFIVVRVLSRPVMSAAAAVLARATEAAIKVLKVRILCS